MRAIPATLGLVCLFLLAVSSLAFPWTKWDQASATYIAGAMLEGKAPYADAWNVKAPGIYFAYALSLLLFGKTAVALRLFDLLWQLATGWMVGRIAEHVFPRRQTAALAASAYLLLYFTQGYWNWAQADGLLALPLAFAVWCGLRAARDDRPRNWLLAAAGVGTAALFKLPLGLFGVFLLLEAGLAAPRGAMHMARRAACLAAGLLLAPALTALYLWSVGALDDFLFAQFVFAPEYIAQARSTVPFTCFFRSLVYLTFLPLYTLGALFAGALLAKSVRERFRSAEVRLVAGWLATAAATLFLHGIFFPYHFLPLFAPAAILGAGMMAELRRFADASPRWRLAPAALLLLFLAVPALRAVQHAAYLWGALAGAHPQDEWAALGRDLRSQTAPHERLYVWGNVPVLYLYAERSSASRFIVPYFVFRAWNSADFRAELLEELRRTPPAVFVLVKEPPPPACTGRDRSAWQAFKSFAELRLLITAEYSVSRETPQFVLYRRRASAPAP